MLEKPNSSSYQPDLTVIFVKNVLPTARLELAIFGLGDRRLIHWATRAVCMVGGESMLCQKALPPGKVGRVLSTLIKVTQPDLFYTAFGLAS